jgi:CBS domain
VAREPRVSERMTASFATLQQGAGVDQLKAELARSSNAVGVVVDSQGRPQWMLDSQGPHLLLQAAPDVPLRAVVDSPEILERLNAGTPGIAVVEEDDRPVGVVTAETIRRYLLEDYSVHTKQMSDHVLAGRRLVPLIVITCATCGWRNELTAFYEDETQCHNGHPLTVDWG